MLERGVDLKNHTLRKEKVGEQKKKIAPQGGMK